SASPCRRGVQGRSCRRRTPTKRRRWPVNPSGLAARGRLRPHRRGFRARYPLRQPIMAARAFRHQRASARGACGFCRPRRRGRMRDRSELHARARLVQGFYTYDAFSPLVLFALERFGYCGAGEAAAWVQGGRIELGGALPVNTSGGLLSEAHVAGWNSICEMVRQLRGAAGASQIANAAVLQWGTAWGDSFILAA